MKLEKLIFLLLFYTVPRLLCAADIGVELTVENTTISISDEIQIAVGVTGTARSPQPQFANTEDFDLQATGTSSQVQIVNGDTTIRTEFSFSATPKKIGTLSLGPARVVIEGKEFKSESVQIQVTKASAAASGGTKGEGANETDRNFRLEADIDNKNPFLNQQILYTFRFLRKGRIQNANLNLPDFKSFLKEEVVKQHEYQTVINGTPWQVVEIKYALFPTSVGAITIDPTSMLLEVVVDAERGRRSFDPFSNESFFNFGAQIKRVRLETNPLSLRVEPLPTAGRPPQFSNLVGKFTLKGALTKSTLAVGDSTTLSLEIEGQGNIRDAKMPEATLNGFKVYDDQPTLKIETASGRAGGSKTYKKALIPLEAGTKIIPPFILTYFDTGEKAYRTIQTAEMQLTVTPAGGADSLTHVTSGSTSQQKEVKMQGEDIMPVKRESVVLRADALSPLERIILMTITLFSPITFVLVWVWKRRENLRLKDRGYFRREKAYKNFLAGVQALNRTTDFDKMSILLRSYLGDKLNFDGQALTPIDLPRKLKPFKISDTSIEESSAFLKLCERGQYGGGTGKLNDADLQKSLVSIVNKLEKEINT